MKKPVLGIASLALMGGFLLAESIDPPQAHIDWMKGVAKATGRMKKGEDVENNAKHVADTMAKVGKFYSTGSTALRSRGRLAATRRAYRPACGRWEAVARVAMTCTGKRSRTRKTRSSGRRRETAVFR